jgi:hypothetical protein
MIMRVTCKDNSGQSLSSQLYRLGYTGQSTFSVLVGKEYEAFGMSLWRGALLLLLADEHHLPNWFPLELFSLSDRRLPKDWAFSPSLNNEEGLQALWGYGRLITDMAHYDGLMERDPEALRYFYEEERLQLQRD